MFGNYVEYGMCTRLNYYLFLQDDHGNYYIKFRALLYIWGCACMWKHELCVTLYICMICVFVCVCVRACVCVCKLCICMYVRAHSWINTDLIVSTSCSHLFSLSCLVTKTTFSFCCNRKQKQWNNMLGIYSESTRLLPVTFAENA